MHGRTRPRCVALLTITLLGIAAAGAAVEAQTPALRQSGPIALTGGTIHTVTNGVIENGTIVFQDGRITAIGRDVAIPAGAERVDASGRQIYPGLVDGYSHMGLAEIGSINVTVDLDERGEFNPNVRAHVAFNATTRHLGVARSNGVLVTLSSPTGGLISGLAAALMLDGWTWEQMTLKPEVGLIVNWPEVRGRNYDEQVRHLREYVAGAGAYRTARAAAPDRHATDSRLEAMIPVLEGRVPVLIHANHLRQIQDAVSWAEEEGLRMVLLGGRDARYVAGLLAERQIPVLITNVLAAPGRYWEPYDHQYALPAELYFTGVRFGITGGATAPYTGRLPYEAGAAIAFGLPPEEAVKAVTLYPAEILGIADRVGSLEIGKDATLIITTGNPLEYSTQIEQAYIEGRRIDMMDSHKQFFEKYIQRVQRTGVPPG